MSKVVVMECPDYEINLLMDRINKGVDLIGGWDSYIRPGMKVLLKPNLIGPKPPESAAVTHCEFVRAVAGILKNKGCTVWIGDSAGGAIAGVAPTAKSMAVAGYEKIAAEEGIQIKNFEREGVVEVKGKYCPEGRIYLAKPLFEADLVINIPKFKTHMSAVFTGAVKNLFGCVPGLRKAQLHKFAPDPESLGRIIADINHSVRVGLNIMDAVVAMEGAGPTAGNPYRAGKIIISTDALAMDVVSLAMLGLKPEDAAIFTGAVESGVGEACLDRIRIDGDYSSPPLLKKFKIPKRALSKEKGKYNLFSYKFFIKIIDFMKARPSIDLKKCKSCNVCVESCPVAAINKSSKDIEYAKCIECLCCHELCMYKAVYMKRDNPFLDFINNKLFK